VGKRDQRDQIGLNDFQKVETEFVQDCQFSNSDLE
jgi:hypothetical protein